MATEKSDAENTPRESLRIGYVPEHFSTPLHFAKEKFGLNAELKPFPTGTGAMTAALKAAELDVAIGLTEGFVADLGKCKEESLPYRLVGTYVTSPLRWAISVGSKASFSNVQQLRGKRVGVSRIGSGSYVMSFVLADQHGWLDESKAPFDVEVVGDFAALRAGVNDKNSADFFMWEHFTTKKFHDNGELKRIGEIYTPWPSWMIAARDLSDKASGDMTRKINQGVEYFRTNPTETIEHITSTMEYSRDDAVAWRGTVEYPDDVRGVDVGVVQKTIDLLKKASVLDDDCRVAGDIIGIRSSTPTVVA